MSIKKIIFLFSILLIIIILLYFGYNIYYSNLIKFPNLISIETTKIREKNKNNVCINKQNIFNNNLEILDLESKKIYTVGGNNPFIYNNWSSLNLFLPYLKLEASNHTFESSCLYKSPTLPNNCLTEDCFKYKDINNNSWLNIEQIKGQECYPNNDCDINKGKKSNILKRVVDKCEEYTFAGPELIIINDQNNNKYILSNHLNDKPLYDISVLPQGYTLDKIIIDAPFNLKPKGDNNECLYNLIIDSNGQKYIQYEKIEIN
jgi:hypothetical protein